MAEYITNLDVSLNEVEEKNLQSLGFKKINVDLNKGAKGNFIYLWYKTEHDSDPITRVQVTFNNGMDDALISAGYTKIDKNLNAGTGGNYIYLWYFKGSTEYDTPIVELDVTVDVQREGLKFKNDWERLACDLNRKAKGNWIHIWMKREKQTYICDITATDSSGLDADYLQQGYIRVDEDTNKGAKGAFVFIWYRQTTNQANALTDLKVSNSNQEYQSLQQQHCMLVSVDLNQGTGGNQVYMWYKKVGTHPIKGITLLVNPDAAPVYERAGVNVIRQNLNEGTDGSTEYLCYHQ
ncbi:uncharacterized protein LOC113746832 [Larimichthys crocea]|uniref:uncharacterized protein LOC113746832 n=1 Tax=Larimichthys crocea TaxID=215358 RepID=UPI000F5DEC6B|nr:uncharacterized protein LOC113746832 [Larimichthys crocea]